MSRLTEFLGKTRLATQAGLAVLLVSTSSVRAQHHAIVEWYAELTEPATVRGDVSIAHSRDIGRVTVIVDFPHQTVTFHTVIKDLVGLRRIEVRADDANGAAGGPAIFTIYEAHEGRFAGDVDAYGRGAGVYIRGHAHSQQRRHDRHCDGCASRR